MREEELVYSMGTNGDAGGNMTGAGGGRREEAELEVMGFDKIEENEEEEGEKVDVKEGTREG